MALEYAIMGLGSNTAITADSTSWFGPLGGYAPNQAGITTEAWGQLKFRGTGTLKALRVTLAANTRAADSTVTIRKAGADTALHCTITSAGRALIRLCSPGLPWE